MATREGRGRSTKPAKPHDAVTQRTTSQAGARVGTSVQRAAEAQDGSAESATSGTSATNGPITLFCLVCGDGVENAFPVNTDKGTTIGEFKNAIKERKPNEFANVDADKLMLWRVNIPEEEEDKFGQLRNNEKTIEELGGVKVKYMTKQVGETFGCSATPGCINVIIERPSEIFHEPVEQKKLIESIVAATLKRQRDKKPIALSSMNSSKRLRLTEAYDIAYQWRDVSKIFERISPIGDEPGPFRWDSRTEEQHAKDYTKHIKENFLGKEYLEGKILEDVHKDKSLLNSNETSGGCDLVVYEPTEVPSFRHVIVLVMELKKALDRAHIEQAIGELIVANAYSTERPVAILTDFQKFGFLWIESLHGEFTICVAFSGDAHKAATFARLLLMPGLIPEDIKDCFPTFERRVRIRPVRTIQEESDVGNLDDFIDEMTPIEREAHEENKYLRLLRNFVPPAYQKSLPYKVVVRDGILDYVH